VLGNGKALRYGHRSRPRGLHLVGLGKSFQDGRVARLESARTDD
jgi:hypothetical protein